MNGLSLRNNRLKFKDCRKIADHFRGIYRRIYPNLIKEIRRMSTCNQLDLQTPGSQPIVPKNLPHHWLELMSFPHDHQKLVDGERFTRWNHYLTQMPRYIASQVSTPQFIQDTPSPNSMNANPRFSVKIYCYHNR